MLIPPAVWAELLAFHHDLPDWLEVVTVTDSSRVTEYRRHVHAGEAEAIALAVEIKPDWLLIDDADGRKLAKAEGAPVVGLMGVLLMAKRDGLVSEVRPLVDSLAADAGFYLSSTIRREVLRLAGEV